MRNGIKVFDCDTHLRPTVGTIIPYLESELRKQAHQWRKVPVRIGMAGERYQPPHRHYFRFRTRNEGWNKDPCACWVKRPRLKPASHLPTVHGRKIPALQRRGFRCRGAHPRHG
jgi:hypothetical protein